jgi:hypothetical protein
MLSMCWEEEQLPQSIKVLQTLHLGINVGTQQVVAIKVLPLSTINNEVTKYLL